MRISIALCTYNGQAHVGEQIRSMVDQSHPADEIVVSDDGSRDGTLDIVRTELDRSGIVWRETLGTSARPLGVAKNFESAVDVSSGDIVILADQDDIWHPDRIARVAQAFSAPQPPLLVACDPILIGEDGRILAMSLLRHLGRRVDDYQPDSVVHTLMARSDLPGMAMAVSRRVRDLAGPIPPDWMHDRWWATWAALHGGFSLDTVASVRYRQHSQNVLGVASRNPVRRLRKLAATGSDASRFQSMFASLNSRVANDPSLAQWHRVVADKANFESRRATLPRAVLPRIAAVLALGLAGDTYVRFSSNGRQNMLRDIVFGRQRDERANSA